MNSEGGLYCNESFQTGRLVKDGGDMVRREERGVRKCGRERDERPYEEDKTRGSTVECVTADGDVSVKVRSEGGWVNLNMFSPRIETSMI